MPEFIFTHGIGTSYEIGTVKIKHVHQHVGRRDDKHYNDNKNDKSVANVKDQMIQG